MGARAVGVAGLKLVKAVVWIVYALTTFASIVIAFAFFLLLFNASPQASFVAFMYQAGMLFSKPFIGMIAPTRLENGGVVAWSALFAIAAYAVAAWVIAGLLNALSRTITRRSLTASGVKPGVAPRDMHATPAASVDVARPTPSVEAEQQAASDGGPVTRSGSETGSDDTTEQD